MLLDPLPPELALNVLSFTPLPELAFLRAMSRQWQDCFVSNEAVFYNQVAFYMDSPTNEPPFLIWMK
ncbi:hypothetical protein NLJ89_g7248 [Agrocybe chaxingu]|uniref:F-box domain-containing protein n=1 Tax=Agrocybe chaxingu TaxID=84603 RepID=A0A9W8JUX0_9AGAR|nr:hypothetical protein NLJ89_g7248 [Agrocybe chaxingu]